MAIVKHFITESIKKTEIDEFLQRRLERAGYGGVNISKTPLGTHIVVYAMRPGLVIGRGGETIRELASILEQQFKMPNPQISVSEIEIPELNAYVVGSKVASALQRGVHFRRAGFWALNQTMEAGALGAEIVISGKLRTERARYEKFKAGYLPKCGEPPTKYMRKAEVHVQLKPGMFGIRVKLMPPDAIFPDRIKIATEMPLTEKPGEAPVEKAEAVEVVVTEQSSPTPDKDEAPSEEKEKVEAEELPPEQVKPEETKEAPKPEKPRRTSKRKESKETKETA
jgi:small subunit ribosomal protein S3